MKSIPIIAYILCSCTQLFAQFNNTNNNAMQTGLVPLNSNDVVEVFDKHIQKQEGTPYWNDQWLNAEVGLTSGRKVYAEHARYNIYRNALEVLYNDVLYEITPDRLQYFRMKKEQDTENQDVSFIRSDSVSADAKVSVLLQVIDTQYKYKLYKEHKIKVEQPNYNIALDTGSKNPRLIKKHNYWIYGGGVLKMLPNNKRAIVKLLAEINPNVKKQLSKINLKEEKGLIHAMSLLVVGK